MSKSVVNYSDQSLTREVGKRSLQAGGVGVGLWLGAAVLPFITVPVLVFMLLVLGGAAYLFG